MALLAICYSKYCFILHDTRQVDSNNDCGIPNKIKSPQHILQKMCRKCLELYTGLNNSPQLSEIDRKWSIALVESKMVTGDLL